VLRTAAAYAELQQLIGFYNARQGQFDDWLYSDPDDNAVTAQQFGVGDGVTTQFQLVRTFGGFTEPVTNLVSTGFPVYLNGTQIFTGVSTISSGILTFTTAPAAGVALAWSGSYYWRVRFDDIDLTLEKMMGGLWSSGDITFTSVK
jgi:uncharacterized protein (TIGR02217 family)